MEYIEYVIMTKKWHCPPTVFDEQPDHMIDLHVRIYNEENEMSELERRRSEQWKNLTH